MWENAYLSIKNPKASRALKWALDPSLKIARFAHTTTLRYVGNFRPQNLGSPLTKCWIRTCNSSCRLDIISLPLTK